MMWYLQKLRIKIEFTLREKGQVKTIIKSYKESILALSSIMCVLDDDYAATSTTLEQQMP